MFLRVQSFRKNGLKIKLLTELIFLISINKMTVVFLLYKNINKFIFRTTKNKGNSKNITGLFQLFHSITLII